MEYITVDKPQLLEILRKNRDSHSAISKEAYDVFKEKTIARLSTLIEEARSGDDVRRFAIGLTVPQDHTSEYDAAIKMLEMEVRGTVQISALDFHRFVLDEWEWKRQWSVSNSNYTSKAAI